MQVFPPQRVLITALLSTCRGGGDPFPTSSQLGDHFIPSLELVFVPRSLRGSGCCGAAAELRFCSCAGIPCEPPPDIPNGQHTGRLQSEFHYGTAVTYSCNRGFPLHGEPSIHCTTRDGHNGVWSEPLPACGGGLGCPRVQGPPGILPAPLLRAGKLQPAAILAPASSRAEASREGEAGVPPCSPFPLEWLILKDAGTYIFSKKMIFRLVS